MDTGAKYGTDDDFEPDDPKSFKEYLLMAADKEVKTQAHAALASAVTATIMAACVTYPWLNNWTIWAAVLCTVVLGVLLLMLTVATYGWFRGYVLASLYRDAFKLLPEDVARDNIGKEKLRLIDELYIHYGNKTMFRHKAAAVLCQLLTTKPAKTD